MTSRQTPGICYSSGLPGTATELADTGFDQCLSRLRDGEIRLGRRDAARLGARRLLHGSHQRLTGSPGISVRGLCSGTADRSIVGRCVGQIQQIGLQFPARPPVVLAAGRWGGSRLGAVAAGGEEDDEDQGQDSGAGSGTAHTSTASTATDQ